MAKQFGIDIAKLLDLAGEGYEMSDFNLTDDTRQTWTAGGYQFYMYWSPWNSMWFIDVASPENEGTSKIVKGTSLTVLEFNLLANTALAGQASLVLYGTLPGLTNFLDKTARLVLIKAPENGKV